MSYDPDAVPTHSVASFVLIPAILLFVGTTPLPCRLASSIRAMRDESEAGGKHHECIPHRWSSCSTISAIRVVDGPDGRRCLVAVVQHLLVNKQRYSVNHRRPIPSAPGPEHVRRGLIPEFERPVSPMSRFCQNYPQAGKPYLVQCAVCMLALLVAWRSYWWSRHEGTYQLRPASGSRTCCNIALFVDAPRDVLFFRWRGRTTLDGFLFYFCCRRWEPPRGGRRWRHCCGRTGLQFLLGFCLAGIWGFVPSAAVNPLVAYVKVVVRCLRYNGAVQCTMPAVVSPGKHQST